MAVKLLVRSARLEELDALASLWREVDALHARLAPGFFVPAAPLSQAMLMNLLGRHDAALLVAEFGGTPAGCIHLELYDTPPESGLRPRRRVHVERLVVTPEYRRRGVGRRLMTAAAAWGQARGATQLVLTVWEGNEPAERFYRELGFAPMSRVYGRDLP
jgi:ribosomal protein S18 acetylase RimI-like enzyme